MYFNTMTFIGLYWNLLFSILEDLVQLLLCLYNYSIQSFFFRSFQSKAVHCEVNSELFLLKQLVINLFIMSSSLSISFYSTNYVRSWREMRDWVGTLTTLTTSHYTTSTTHNTNRKWFSGSFFQDVIIQ